ncbi:MAG TPA: stage II sporulation protein M [Galbitalea sp.]|jgi:uncharacterized membrane protein SpoIIM required for sporulation|nr:stage II sporulation protein M [Galbitalea sp.]
MRSFKQMDLDALAAARREDWERLARLSKAGRLSGPESDELINLYQAGASDLSTMRTTIGPSGQGEQLSLSLSRARRTFTGARRNVLEQLAEFFVASLPAALYRIRWVTVGVTVATALIAVVAGLWINANPSLLLHLGSPAYLKSIADSKFVGYYSAHPAAAFAGQVWTHNATITALTLVFGITGIVPAYFMISNAINVGEAGALVNQYGHVSDFWLYIAPHGQLELYSVFTSGAAGFMLFWALVAPGRRTRAQALAEDGRAFFTIVIGLIISLAMSGAIEGFVTYQPWPWPIKIGIGTIALLIFLSYQWILGRRAYRAGRSGDLDEFEAGARQLTAG